MKYDFNNLDKRFFPGKGNKYGFLIKYNTGSKLTANLQLSDTLDPFNVEVENEGSFMMRIYHRIMIPAGEKLTFGMLNSISYDFYNKEDTVTFATRFLNQNYIGGFRKLAPNFMPFWGAEPMTYFAENLFYNELMVQFEPKRNLYLQIVSQYFYANPFESIISSIKDSPYYMGEKQFLFGGGATIGYRSPIGPISFSVGKGNTLPDLQYFINIGFYFDRD
jgi:NTE family protein